MPNYAFTNVLISNLDLDTAFGLIDFDSLYMSWTGQIFATATGSEAIHVRKDNDIIVAGQVFGTFGIHCAPLSGTTASNTITITGTRSVVGTSGAIFLEGQGNVVSNSGTISGGLYGIFANSGYAEIVNAGTIVGSASAIHVSGMTGETNSVSNYGFVSSPNLAVECNGGSDDRVVNGGRMIGTVVPGEGDDWFDSRAGTIQGNVHGQGGDDRLLGSAGHDWLDGGVGNDVLKGHAGDDVYSVGSVLDVVSEKGGDGDDLVLATISVDLVSGKFIGEVEDVILLPTLGNLSAFGNSLANVPTGNEGANTLDGRGGADSLAGGAGADTYVVDNVGDVVDEAGAPGGTDTVRASISFSLNASATVLGAIERLELTGSAANNGIGNASANWLTGNAGSNGLAGGAGADTFRFVAALTASNADTISDFTVI